MYLLSRTCYFCIKRRTWFVVRFATPTPTFLRRTHQIFAQTPLSHSRNSQPSPQPNNMGVHGTEIRCFNAECRGGSRSGSGPPHSYSPRPAPLSRGVSPALTQSQLPPALVSRQVRGPTPVPRSSRRSGTTELTAHDSYTWTTATGRLGSRRSALMLGRSTWYSCQRQRGRAHQAPHQRSSPPRPLPPPPPPPP